MFGAESLTLSSSKHENEAGLEVFMLYVCLGWCVIEGSLRIFLSCVYFSVEHFLGQLVDCHSKDPASQAGKIERRAVQQECAQRPEVEQLRLSTFLRLRENFFPLALHEGLKSCWSRKAVLNTVVQFSSTACHSLLE